MTKRNEKRKWSAEVTKHSDALDLEPDVFESRIRKKLHAPLITLRIDHKTTYHDHEPVSFGPHRLLLRPRESRDLRLISSDVTVTPDAAVTWAQDVFGDTVATTAFQAMADTLIIDSHAELQLDAAALAGVQYRRGDKTDTLSLLKDLSDGVSRSINYHAREDEGTQSPIESLDRGWGSYRDLAVLFAEVVRNLGFRARIVTGYLHSPDNLSSVRGAGATHAWTEVFVPGAGWITFDPTNRAVGGSNLIPVAVVRDIRQAVPVAGSFVGASTAFADMSVEVLVSA